MWRVLFTQILEHFEKFQIISVDEQKAWRSRIKVERKTFEARGVDLTHKDCANMCRYALEVIEAVFEALAISRGVLLPSGAPNSGSLTPPPHLATTPTHATFSSTTPIGRGSVVTPTQALQSGLSVVQASQGVSISTGNPGKHAVAAAECDAQRYWDKASMADLLRHSKNEVKLACCWLIHRVLREPDGVLYLEADIRCIPLATLFLAGKVLHLSFMICYTPACLMSRRIHIHMCALVGVVFPPHRPHIARSRAAWTRFVHSAVQANRGDRGRVRRLFVSK